MNLRLFQESLAITFKKVRSEASFGRRGLHWRGILIAGLTGRASEIPGHLSTPPPALLIRNLSTKLFQTETNEKIFICFSKCKRFQ